MLRRMERMFSAEDNTPILSGILSIAVAENSVNKQSGLLVHRDNTYDLVCSIVTH
jgi:hypothetical protein